MSAHVPSNPRTRPGMLTGMGATRLILLAFCAVGITHETSRWVDQLLEIARFEALLAREELVVRSCAESWAASTNLRISLDILGEANPDRIDALRVAHQQVASDLGLLDAPTSLEDCSTPRRWLQARPHLERSRGQPSRWPNWRFRLGTSTEPVLRLWIRWRSDASR